MHEYPLLPLASIFVLGVGSQWLAWKLKWPAILTLLGVGLLAGPVSGWLEPDQLLGDFLQPMVALSVAVILFEGGLNLRLTDLKDPNVSHSVWRLVVVGALVTWAGVTTVAMLALEYPLGVALLLGAVLVVTGPTVILPLIRQFGFRGKIGPILRWEGMINDPLGAVLAVLVFEAIRAGSLYEAGGIALQGMVSTLFIGVIGAYVVGSALSICLRKFWIPDHLHAPLALGLALLLFAVSDQLQPESGLVSVTLLGMYLANQKQLDLHHVQEFKENLSVLLISTLFIILSARLDWEALLASQARWLLFVGLVVLVVRPAAVFTATLGTGLNWKEKLLLSAVGPRGIVAAAVASVFALELQDAGFARAGDLMTITFLVIAGSVAFSGLLAGPLSQILGLSHTGSGSLLLVGCHPPARDLACSLRDEGVQVTLVDSNANNVALARLQGLDAIHGDILSRDLGKRLDLAGVGTMVAMTANDEVNTLAVLRFREHLGRAQVFRLSPDADVPESRGRIFSSLTRSQFEEAWNSGWRPRVESLEQVGSEDRTKPLFILKEEGDWEVVPSDWKGRSEEGARVLALAPPSEEAGSVASV